MTARAYVLVRGLVQGVGFRWFVREEAEGLGLSGWVRNRADGAVEAEAEGDSSDVERFVARLRAGPTFARVDSVQTRPLPPRRQRGTFEIVR